MLDPALEIEDQTNTVSLAVALAEYAARFTIDNPGAMETARHCLIDALGGGFDALREPECAAHLAPLVPGAMMPGGSRVPGTSLELDPAQAAFCTALMLCRSASHGHWQTLSSGRAADSLGALLAVSDYQGRKAIMEGKPPPKVRDVLTAMIKTLEIQGVLGPDQATIRLARVAVTTVVTARLGGALGQIVTALSYACIDGGLPTEAEEQQEIGRRDWARADAMSRAVRHACQAMTAACSYLTPLDLKAVDLAGKLLGAKPWAPKKSFGTAIIDELADTCAPREAGQLTAKFHTSVDRYFPGRQAERIKSLFATPERLDDLPVNELLAALVINGAR
ncbi:MAG TPA: MmgE/PrpD family protein [Steroidobacteraceae bacterium]|jgi:2-methylcitrate dehydratase PrpD